MKKFTVFALCLFIFFATLTLVPSVSSASQAASIILKAILNKEKPDEQSISIAACSPYHDYLYGPFGGIGYMTGTICDYSGQFTFDYVNFAILPGVRTNGQIQCQININDPYYPTQMSFTYNGGPLFYDISGEFFSVHFYEFFINYQIGYGGLTVTSVSGGLTVNGQYIPASVVLAEALF